MVSFKKLFLATSLVLSKVGAAPAPSGTLDIATAEVDLVNSFAIQPRDVNHEDIIAGPPKKSPPQKSTPQKSIPQKAPPKKSPPKKCRPTKRDSLAINVLHAGTNANQVMENEYVDAMQIKSNGGEATVADLSGCTALFFYMDTTLRRVVHILCGNEAADARTAAQQAAGSTSVTIGASSQVFYDAAKGGVLAGKPGITINDASARIYSGAAVTDTVAVTLRGRSGSTSISEGTGARICKQVQ